MYSNHFPLHDAGPLPSTARKADVSPFSLYKATKNTPVLESAWTDWRLGKLRKLALRSSCSELPNTLSCHRSC